MNLEISKLFSQFKPKTYQDYQFKPKTTKKSLGSHWACLPSPCLNHHSLLWSPMPFCIIIGCSSSYFHTFLFYFSTLVDEKFGCSWYFDTMNHIIMKNTFYICGSANVGRNQNGELQVERAWTYIILIGIPNCCHWDWSTKF